MDPLTQKFYSSRVKETTDLYKTLKGEGVSKYFTEAFAPGSRILDIGSGGGRDLFKLINMGYDAYGVDASPDMVKASVNDYPVLEGRVRAGEIPAETLFFSGGFDGILCSALFMHIPDELCFDAAFSVRSHLKEMGRLLVSFPLERPDVDAEGRLPDGRLFLIRPSGYYTLLFERLGFRKISYCEEDDSLGRQGIRWGVLICELESERGTRSIDKIESVLNRDRKTATYKLALFRALADIAAAQYNSVTWYGNGMVGVPVNLITEKWLVYYWNIFESEEFIPQINGENPGSIKPVKFRKSLTGLIEQYRSQGGLNFFFGSLLNDTEIYRDSTVRKVFKDISETIIKGPVAYSGGSLEDGAIFTFDSTDRNILVPSDIWKEFCLMHHWIHDALILRWGELTEQMSKGEIPSSRVIELLLKRPVSDRDTIEPRIIYEKMESLECVWTGVRLDKKFDVDHVIPFSLWHNNDLWNLLPAHPKVNNQKRDKLPERTLVLKRKDSVLYYWTVLSESLPQRFITETSKFTGKSMKSNWELPLFNALVEAVEITAMQRGVERWNIS